MELLQKLTLYDLLGYTLPGCIFILVCGGEDRKNQLLHIVNKGCGQGGTIFALICCGYILGIVIAEIMNLILKKTGQLEISDKMYDKYHVNDDRINQSLEKAGIIQAAGRASGLELYKLYHGEMYAKIQTDEKYFRIHNYASAELLYKNMILVSLMCMISFILKQDILGIVLGVVGVICFYMRWKRFYEKKLGYCLGWFLDKYR